MISIALSTVSKPTLLSCRRLQGYFNISLSVIRIWMIQCSKSQVACRSPAARHLSRIGGKVPVADDAALSVGVLDQPTLRITIAFYTCKMAQYLPGTSSTHHHWIFTYGRSSWS